MSVKIKVIIPNSGMDRATLDSREQMLRQYVSPECEISVDCIRSGPISIESNSDEVAAEKALITQAIEAEQAGYHALVVYCFSDLGVHALRENLTIPVIGPGAVTIAVADMISVRFTVVTTAQKNVPRTTRRLQGSAVCREKMAAVRAMNIPVEALRERPDVTREYLERVCRNAIEIDGADTILLGCLGFAGYGAEIQEKMGITVLDPSSLSVAYAETCARNGIRHSRLAYPAYERRETFFGGGRRK